MVKFINAKFYFDKKVSFSFSRVIFFVIVIFSLGLTIGIALYSAKNRSLKIIQPQASIAPATDTLTPSPTEVPVSDNIADWKTYSNDKYKILMQYPSDWRVIDFQSETNMGTLDTFGFIPVNLKNSYCDLEADAYKLIQNYKINNPFSGYEEYAQTSTKVESCSIQIRVEENPEKLSIKDYLKKVYASIAVISDEVQVKGKIDSLNETKAGKIEQTRSNYAFTKFLGGIDGSSLETDIDENKNQAIINTGNYIIFITNQINQPVNSQKTDDIFDQIISTFKFIENSTITSAISETDLLGYWFTPHTLKRNITFLKDNQFKFNDGKKGIYSGNFSVNGFIVTLKFSDGKMPDIALKFSKDQNAKYLENNEGELFVQQ